MSRAEATALPAAPRLGAALRAAAFDFYYHSIRLVPANLAWGLPFLVAIWFAVIGAVLPALLVLVLLGVPAAGVFRLAALAVRGEDVNLSDAFRAWRTWFIPALAAGVVFTVAAAMFATNVVVGLTVGGATGWAFATLAGWGLLTTWLGGLAFWALLVDPQRAGISARAAARLAALLVVAHPGRLAALGLVAGAIVVASLVLFVAIVTVSVAIVALLAAHFVLPATDRLEARLAGGAAVRRDT